jgi:hypothetical protein
MCIKALAGAGCLHGRQLLFPRDVEIRSFMRVGGDARAARLGPRTSRSRTCRARRRLVPLVGNWSEMQPPCQRLVVLPVRVLTKICMPSLRRSSKGTTILKLLASERGTPP